MYILFTVQERVYRQPWYDEQATPALSVVFAEHEQWQQPVQWKDGSNARLQILDTDQLPIGLDQDSWIPRSQNQTWQGSLQIVWDSDQLPVGLDENGWLPQYQRGQGFTVISMLWDTDFVPVIVSPIFDDEPFTVMSRVNMVQSTQMQYFDVDTFPTSVIIPDNNSMYPIQRRRRRSR